MIVEKISADLELDKDQARTVALAVNERRKSVRKSTGVILLEFEVVADLYKARIEVSDQNDERIRLRWKMWEATASEKDTVASGEQVVHLKDELTLDKVRAMATDDVYAFMLLSVGATS